MELREVVSPTAANATRPRTHTTSRAPARRSLHYAVELAAPAVRACDRRALGAVPAHPGVPAAGAASLRPLPVPAIALAGEQRLDGLPAVPGKAPGREEPRPARRERADRRAPAPAREQGWGQAAREDGGQGTQGARGPHRDGGAGEPRARRVPGLLCRRASR